MYAIYLHHPLSIRYFFSLVAVVHASVSLGYLGVSLWPQQGVAASLALAVPQIIFSPLLYDRSQVPVHAPPPTQPDFTAADVAIRYATQLPALLSWIPRLSIVYHGVTAIMADLCPHAGNAHPPHRPCVVASVMTPSCALQMRRRGVASRCPSSASTLTAC